MTTKKQLEQRVKDVDECMNAIKNEVYGLMIDFVTITEEVVAIKKRLEKLEGDDLK